MGLLGVFRHVVQPLHTKPLQGWMRPGWCLETYSFVGNPRGSLILTTSCVHPWSNTSNPCSSHPQKYEKLIMGSPFRFFPSIPMIFTIRSNPGRLSHHMSTHVAKIPSHFLWSCHFYTHHLSPNRGRYCVTCSGKSRGLWDSEWDIPSGSVTSYLVDFSTAVIDQASTEACT